MPNDWWIYLIETENGRLYTGITNNLEKRITSHFNGTSKAKFFRTSRPKKLVYSKSGYSHSEALKEEVRIKKMSRDAKKIFIAESN